MRLTMNNILMSAGITMLVMFTLNQLGARNPQARRLIKGNGGLTAIPASTLQGDLV